jgi:hypothetical protein
MPEQVSVAETLYNMATYGTKYYCQIADFSGNTFVVNLKQLNYSGSTQEIGAYSFQPLRISYMSGRDGIDNVLHGSNATFTFYCRDGENYDDLLESEFHDFQVEVLRDSELYWLGWLQPDYLSRRFAVPSYYISLTATDGLADLKYIEYPASATTLGFDHQIDIIKTCLQQTGLELDIVDQLNLSEANTTEPLLKSVLANAKRFINTKDGVTKYLNCYDTLSRVLEPYNVKLVQAEGKWNITQKLEVVSNRHTYDWATLTASTTSDFNRVVDVTNYKALADSDELSKVAPYKKMEVTFKNRNLGDNLFSNGIFDENINGWVNGSGTNAHYLLFWNSTEQTLNVANPRGLGSGPNVNKYFTSPVFGLEKIGTGATNTIRFSIDADITVTFSASPVTHYYPDIKIEFIKSGGTTSFVTFNMEPGLKTYTTSFKFSTDGDYYFKIWMIADPESQYIVTSAHYDNVEAYQIYDDGDVTFDKYFLGTNTGTTAIRNYEKTLYFADALQTNDVGALKYHITGLTSSWTTYYTAQTQFSNGSFDGPSIVPWVEEGSGAFWTYLGGLSNDVNAVGSGSSKRLMQGWFKPGTYGIEVSATNDNDISAGYVPNGWVKIVARNRDGDLTDLGAQYLDAGDTNVALNFTFTLREESYLGFQVGRAGPGSDLDMRVGNIEVTAFDAPDVGVSIQELYLYQKLSQYSRFKNYLNITLKDSCTICFYHLLKIGTKRYLISGYSYDVKNNNLDLELVEFLDAYVFMTFTQTTMSTVDGN